MRIERSFGWRLVCKELVVCAHLNVVGVVADLAIEVVVLTYLCVDVGVDLDLRLGEVAEGDSAVECVVEWRFRSNLIFSKNGFDLFITEAVQPLVKFLHRHGSCR